MTNQKELTLRDADALANSSRASDVAYVAPVISGVREEIAFSGEGTESSILGITSDYQFVQNLTISEGEFITDERGGGTRCSGCSRSVLLKNCGKNEGIVGNSVRIGGYPFRIVGVTEARWQQL